MSEKYSEMAYASVCRSKCVAPLRRTTATTTTTRISARPLQAPTPMTRRIPLQPVRAIEIDLKSLIDPFFLSYKVEFGRVLKLTLKTELPPNSTSPHSFEDALHTYFAVSNIRSISIAGLENTAFIDKVDGASLKSASGLPIQFSGETDRVYVDTLTDCLLIDDGWRRIIRIAKTGSVSTVVWNPWNDKSKRMADFGDREWTEMVCIETANVGSGRIGLSPGESHSTTAIVSVEIQ